MAALLFNEGEAKVKWASLTEARTPVVGVQAVGAEVDACKEVAERARAGEGGLLRRNTCAGR